jgi:hypothetical protein
MNIFAHESFLYKDSKWTPNSSTAICSEGGVKNWKKMLLGTRDPQVRGGFSLQMDGHF